MSLRLPICDYCRHYYEGNDELMCCDAFPDGIPTEKIRMDDDGRECNKGIGFENVDTMGK